MRSLFLVAGTAALVALASLSGCSGCGANAPATAVFTAPCLPLNTDLGDRTRHCTVTYDVLRQSPHRLEVKLGTDSVSSLHVAAKLAVERGAASVTVVEAGGAEHVATVAPGAPAAFAYDVSASGMKGSRYFFLVFTPLAGGDGGVPLAEHLTAELTYEQR